MSDEKAVWAAETLSGVLCLPHVAHRAASHPGIQRVIIADPELRALVGKEVLDSLTTAAAKPGLHSILFQNEGFRKFAAEEVLKSLVQTLELNSTKDAAQPRG